MFGKARCTAAVGRWLHHRDSFAWLQVGERRTSPSFVSWLLWRYRVMSASRLSTAIRVGPSIKFGRQSSWGGGVQAEDDGHGNFGSEERLAAIIKEAVLETIHECSRDIALAMLPTIKPALEAAVLCAMEDATRDAAFGDGMPARRRPKSPPRDERDGMGNPDASDAQARDQSNSVGNGPQPADAQASPASARPPKDAEDQSLPVSNEDSRGLRNSSVRRERDQFLAKFAHAEIFGQTSGQSDSMKKHTKTAYQTMNERMIIDPSNRMIWDGFCLAIILFMSFELPVRLAFAFDQETPVGWLIYDWLVVTVFFTDMVLNFRTGYVEEGEVILSPRKIARKYISGWFVVDLLSTIPWDVLFCTFTECGAEAIRASAALTALRIFKLLRLLRLLRVTRAFKYIEQWEGGRAMLTSNAMRIIKLISTMLVFTHWDGCLHYLVAKLEANGTQMQLDSWVIRSDTHLLDPGGQYLMALFNAFSQMLCIGYGAVDPVRLSEVAMTLLSMILGATLYGLFVASLTSFLADSDASAKQYASQLDMLNQYMKHRMLPPDLRIKMRSYLELSFPNKRAFNEESIMQSLNLPLRKEVAWHKCRVVLQRLPLYDSYASSTETSGMMTALALALQRQVFVAGDYILREGEHGSDMFFVASGEVAVVTGPPGRHTEVTRLREGAFFGEMALLEHSERHLASVLVVSFCDAFWMTRQRYQRLVRDYPTVKEYLESIARLRLAASLERASSSGANSGLSMPDREDLRASDLQTLVSRAKTSGSAMAPIHQGLTYSKAKKAKAKPAAATRPGRRRSVAAMLGFVREPVEKPTGDEVNVEGDSFTKQVRSATTARRKSQTLAISGALQPEREWAISDKSQAMMSSAAAASILYGGHDRHAERMRVAAQMRTGSASMADKASALPPVLENVTSDESPAQTAVERAHRDESDPDADALLSEVRDA